MNVIKLTAVFITALFLFIGCSGAGGGLSGTYTNEDLGDWTMTFSGNTVTNSFLGESTTGTYEVKDGNITMTFDGETATTKYTLEGNKLTISESGMTLTFIKK